MVVKLFVMVWGQSQVVSAECVDVLITNAIILDYWGIVKADIGIKDGRIVGARQVIQMFSPMWILSLAPEQKLSLEKGKIVTAGGIDTHIHFICPQQAQEGLVSGVTTFIGGGTGPVAGISINYSYPGIWNMYRMLEAVDELPINVGLFGKGCVSQPEAIREQITAGAIGLKIHEDWGQRQWQFQLP